MVFNKLFKRCGRAFSMPHKPNFGALEILKFIGPGMLVTVGFIDPGNWASNIAAGSQFGYSLLWMVTLSTLMLILLQHNAAHLGIATGLCMSEAATKYLKPSLSRTLLFSAMLASVSTALAEILGGAIALNMLFKVPLRIGSILVVLFISFLLFTSAYRLIEKLIIAFVSLIGLSFIYELSLVHVNWGDAAVSWTWPAIPLGAMPVVMSVLGAVVMPHNIFLHSEIIQSRQWNLENDKVIKKQLDFEFADTLFSMLAGWGINSAMIILAAAAFYFSHISVTEIQQAGVLLEPLLGKFAFIVFAVALLFSGLSSTLTAGMAGGSIFSGIFSEPYDVKDIHTKVGVILTYVPALGLIFMVSNPFNAMIFSQMCLSIQLPLTIFMLIYLTSSKQVMGKFVNTRLNRYMLLLIGFVVTYLNIRLLGYYLF